MSEKMATFVYRNRNNTPRKNITNLNPKSLTGKETMYETLADKMVREFKMAALKSQVEVIVECERALLDEFDKYERLMYTNESMAILRLSAGKRFDRLLKMRSVLCSKGSLLLRMASDLAKKRYKIEEEIHKL